MKILCIGAHPADCTDLAGGTLMKHSREGDTIITATMTDGIYSHGSREPIKEIRALKRSEFHKSSELLGAVDAYCFGYQDEPFSPNLSMAIRDLAKFIAEQAPDVVITHHPNEFAHWDHAETGKTVCRALKTAIKFPWLHQDNHWVPTVYFFAVAYRPEATRIGVNVQAPSILIDIEGVVADKVVAMMCFASQGHNDSDKMWQRMDSYESEMGRADGLRYSEGFIQYYPLKRNLLEVNHDQGFYGEKK